MRYYVEYNSKGKIHSGYPTGESIAKVLEQYQEMGFQSVVVRDITPEQYKSIYGGI